MRWRMMILLVLGLLGGVAALAFVSPLLAYGTFGSVLCQVASAGPLDKRAEKGDPDAQAMMAGYSFTGECGADDPQKGRSYAEAAAAHGHRDGLFWLALYKARGVGGPKDREGAIATNESLIKKGDIRGARNLAKLHMLGRKGATEAYYYLRLADFLSHEHDLNTRTLRKASLDEAFKLEAQLDRSEIAGVEARLRAWWRAHGAKAAH
ncbi:MAG: hypothetical protein QNJ94_05140 [Alphaproteobacteria bacterium]|nr:hypothetical protein [Alphaproteobacteria bacterium]